MKKAMSNQSIRFKEKERKKMTSCAYIEYLLKCDPSFLGCFHVKSLPPDQPKKFPTSLIVYSDKHWMGVMFINKRLCLYFDSFGEKVQDSELVDYLSAASYTYVMYNSVQIQHDSSDKCGLFCVLFIKLVHSLVSFTRFLQLFNRNNLVYNDWLIDDKINFAL